MPDRASIIISPLLAVLAALVSLAGAGCERSAGAAHYFPLEPGHHWQYRIERTTMDGHRELRHVVQTGKVPPGAAFDAMRITAGGLRYLYEVDDAGIFRLDLRPALPVRGEPQRTLVLPHQLDETSSWQTQSHTAVLENSGPPWETLFRITAPVAMQYQVEQTDAAIDTPAGRFEGCLVIRGVGSASVDAGNYIGRTRIEIASREWFAPGVGLVRMERDETTGAAALSGGRLLVELDRWWHR
ncbi:MAG: hypothetical protein WD928_02745 [Gammaproteobacteria bacterium]